MEHTPFGAGLTAEEAQRRWESQPVLLAACEAAWIAIDTVTAMDCKPGSFKGHCLPLLAPLGDAIKKARGEA